MIWFYLLAVNLTAFLTMGSDKRRAISNGKLREGSRAAGRGTKRGKYRWRVPEKTLFLLALAGGSAGALAGMYVFRHKTKHLKFVIGLPLILILQVLTAFVWLG